MATSLLSPLRNGMVATICNKQSFCLHLFETEGNGHLYVPTERNHSIQTGPKILDGGSLTIVCSDVLSGEFNISLLLCEGTVSGGEVVVSILYGGC